MADNWRKQRELELDRRSGRHHCTNCGTKGTNYCTNGRCEPCHNVGCSPGGGDRPGHGFRVTPVFNLDGSKVK